jgi:hypothetical protein
VVSAESITSLKPFNGGQWPRQNGFSGAIDPAEIRILSIFSANIRPYVKRL